MNKSTSILLILFIIGLIVFDAAQQKFYLDTFSLGPDGGISFLEVLTNHLVRWVIWVAIAIPYGRIIWKKFFLAGKPTDRDWMIIALCTFATTFFALVAVSIQSLYNQGVEMSEFGEFFQFFIYQKGLNFTLASITLTLLLFNHSKSNTIHKQTFEIEHLQKKTSDLKEALKKEEIPHLNVKTGYKLKPIALNEIIWIQSDDYCVKIHTNEKSFTLRQSLKVLAEKLEPHGFSRIHRTALVNISFLDQINYESSRVKLINDTEIPFSKNGIKSLKKRVKDVTA